MIGTVIQLEFIIIFLQLTILLSSEEKWRTAFAKLHLLQNQIFHPNFPHIHANEKNEPSVRIC